MATTLQVKLPSNVVDRSVYVSNIANGTSVKDLSDFFSFCGPLENIILEANAADQLQHAAVTFGDLNTAATALLLSGAIISGKSIEIARFPQSESSTVEEQQNVQVQHDEPTPAPAGKTAVSVVSDILAKGYVLGENALQAAKEFDEKHNISLKFKVAVESAKNKALKIDETYKITEKAQAAGEAASSKAKKLDEEYHISEKATYAAAAGAATASVLASKAMSVNAISSAVGFVKRGIDVASATAEEIKAETQRKIEEKEKAKEQNTN